MEVAVFADAFHASKCILTARGAVGHLLDHIAVIKGEFQAVAVDKPRKRASIFVGIGSKGVAINRLAARRLAAEFVVVDCRGA